jgi:hypothetical protein
MALRQLLQLGALDFIEQIAPRLAISPHRSGVEIFDQGADADSAVFPAQNRDGV